MNNHIVPNKKSVRLQRRSRSFYLLGKVMFIIGGLSSAALVIFVLIATDVFLDFYLYSLLSLAACGALFLGGFAMMFTFDRTPIQDPPGVLR